MPEHSSIVRVQAEDRNSPGLVPRGRQKNALTPKNGGGMSAPAQVDFPVNVCVGNFGGNSFGVANACAIRPPKAAPFLGGGDAGQRSHCKSDDYGSSDDFHTSNQIE